MEGANGRRLLGVLRVVGLCLFAAYFLRHEALLDAVQLALTRVDWTFWTLGVAALFVALGLSALRLRCLASASGFAVAWHTLYIQVLRGAALNAVTLMGVGEGYRSHSLSKATGCSFSHGAVLVVADRLMGLGLLVLVGGSAWLGRSPSIRGWSSPTSRRPDWTCRARARSSI